MLGGALEAYSTQTCMVLWMKASGLFTVPQNNTYPLGITAIGMLLVPWTVVDTSNADLGIVLTLCTSVAIDATGVHAPYGFIACGVQIITCVVLLCWNMVGTAAKMAAFCTLPRPLPRTVKFCVAD